MKLQSLPVNKTGRCWHDIIIGIAKVVERYTAETRSDSWNIVRKRQLNIWSESATSIKQQPSLNLASVKTSKPICTLSKTKKMNHETDQCSPIWQENKPFISRISKCIFKKNSLCLNHTSFSPIYLEKKSTIKRNDTTIRATQRWCSYFKISFIHSNKKMQTDTQQIEKTIAKTQHVFLLLRSFQVLNWSSILQYHDHNLLSQATGKKPLSGRLN